MDVYTCKLDEFSSQEILTAASNLVEVCEGDLDACLGNELVQFADFVNAYQEEQGEDVSRENFMYHLFTLYSRSEFRVRFLMWRKLRTPHVLGADDQ